MAEPQAAANQQMQNGQVKEGPDAERRDIMRREGSLSLFRDIDLEDLDLAAHGEGESAPKPGYTSTRLDVPVVIVSSEISPWSKSGGLALVTASLAVEFAERGHRTMAISPMYDNYKDVSYMTTIRINLMGGEHEVKLFHLWHQVSEGKGVDYIFVDHPCYHRPGGLYYNAQEGVEYADNLYRFALFCLAALEAPNCCAQGVAPYGDRCMFVTNDWQTALLPVYLTYRMRPWGKYNDSRCLFVVHNFGYQGIYPCNKLVNFDGNALPSIVKNVDIGDFGLDGTGAYEHLIYQYPPHERSYDGDDGNVFNLTKGAIMTCDRLLTVSPGYANEMKTPEGGFRLEELVKQKEFFMVGILNGIDVAAWNPRTDKTLMCQYNADSLVEGKAACKRQLQQKVGLAPDPELLLVSFVGRLTDQKGIDMICDSLDWMMQDTGNGITGKIQVFLMGNGDENHVCAINGAAGRFPGRVAASKFIPEVEHLLYAGSDFLLMPSRYEPCGLPQMCAQRYGCVPIVTLCGGLNDSVIVEPKEEATGFGILPLSIHKFKEISYQAFDTFINRPDEYRAMQLRGFMTDFSWRPRIDEYERNVDWALGDPPYMR